MATTNYYSLNGEIIGEKTVGGTRTDYLTDALGSVVATTNQSAQVVNTYRYKPYGAQLAKTGVGADPAFRWVGTEGYRQSGKKFSDVYVRARHDDSLAGQWTTKDPIRIRPRRGSYIYSNCSPTLMTDRYGLIAAIVQPGADCCKRAVGMARCDNTHCAEDWGTCPWENGGNFDQACNETQNCPNIVAALQAAALACYSMCKDLKGYGKKKTPWDAQTVCCTDDKGGEHFCGYLCCPSKRFPTDPCILKCLQAHEERHKDQCEGVIKPPPGNEPPRYWNDPGPWGECDAYHIQMQCLLSLAQKFGCTIIPPLIYTQIKQCEEQASKRGVGDQLLLMSRVL